MTGLERVQVEIEEVKRRQVHDFLAAVYDLSPSEFHRMVGFFLAQAGKAVPVNAKIKLKSRGGGSGPGTGDLDKVEPTQAIAAAAKAGGKL